LTFRAFQHTWRYIFVTIAYNSVLFIRARDISFTPFKSHISLQKTCSQFNHAVSLCFGHHFVFEPAISYTSGNIPPQCFARAAVSIPGIYLSLIEVSGKTRWQNFQVLKMAKDLIL
jgi:hypothetical protein